MKFTLQDLTKAYRKAKQEAFYDTNCAHWRKFADYEGALAENLQALLEVLNTEPAPWTTDVRFLGRETYVSKNGGTAELRPVINATVDYMIISALWVMTVGEHFEKKLRSCAVGSRLRRVNGEFDAYGPGLFEPHFAPSARWKSDGLAVIEEAIADSRSVAAIVLDLKDFHRNVDPAFLLDAGFQEGMRVHLSPAQTEFTKKMVQSVHTWNSAHGYESGLPAGLSFTRLALNVILGPLDEVMKDVIAPLYYARYGDDLFLVMEPKDEFADYDGFLNWLALRSRLFQRVRPVRGASPQLAIILDHNARHLLLFSDTKRGFEIFGHASLEEIRDLRQHGVRYQYDLEPGVTDLPLAIRLFHPQPKWITLLLEAESKVPADLPAQWYRLRKELDGTVTELRPPNLFRHEAYLPRVLGVMVACWDWEEARSFFRRLITGMEALELGSEDHKLEWKRNLANKLFEAGLRSITTHFEAFFSILPRVGIYHFDGSYFSERFYFANGFHFSDATPLKLRHAAEALRRLDWGRRSYWSYWQASAREVRETDAARSQRKDFEAVISFEDIESARQALKLPEPHWLALAFPTRPGQPPFPAGSDLEKISAQATHGQRQGVAAASIETATGVPSGPVFRSPVPESETWAVGYGLGSDNPLLTVPPVQILDTAPEVPDHRFYVRYAQRELIQPDGHPEGGRDWFYFDGFSAVWASENGQWTSVSEFVNFYDRAELFILAVRIDPSLCDRFPILNRILADLNDGVQPGGWYEITLGSGSFPAEDEEEVSVYANLFRPPAGRRLLDLRVIESSALRSKLARFVDMGFLDQADGEEVKRILEPVNTKGVNWAVVYDVGQGNAIGLCDPQGAVTCYFDMGGSVMKNRKSFPERLERFCYTNEPPIILSHWDWDHWSSSSRDKRALKMEWLAPFSKEQDISSSHAALIARIIKNGGKVWPIQHADPDPREGRIQLVVCEGKDRNNSGLALTLHETPERSGKRMLMPGDAEYQYIPGLEEAGYFAVVAPHHGGPLSGVIPCNTHPGTSRLVYSAGKGCTYDHPLDETRHNHHTRGWVDGKYAPPAGQLVRLTTNRENTGLGHVLLSWNEVSEVPLPACGMRDCQLAAQCHQQTSTFIGEVTEHDVAPSR